MCVACMCVCVCVCVYVVCVCVSIQYTTYLQSIPAVQNRQVHCSMHHLLQHVRPIIIHSIKLLQTEDIALTEVQVIHKSVELNN